MKWILIVSMIYGGQPVELSRSNGNPFLTTKQICETAGIVVLTMVIRDNPKAAGKIFFECQPENAGS